MPVANYSRRPARRTRVALGLVFFVIPWTGCGFVVERQPDLTGTGGRVLGYNSLRSMIFERHCISCHGDKGGVNLETYSKARSELNAIMNRAVVAMDMPPPPAAPLSASERALIQAWVNAGGPENDVSPSSAPLSPVPEDLPTGPVRYAQVRQKVFKPKCVWCHGEKYTKHGVDLRTYESVIRDLDRVVKEALVKKKMPPRHPLTSERQAWLKAWVDEGAPEN